MANVKYAAVMLAAAALLLFSGSVSAQQWEPLGTATQEPQVQRSVINVGGNKRGFRAIRFDVKRSDVEILDLKVVYGNGVADDIRLRQTFKAGTSSRAIDLNGQGRLIKQIIVTFYARGPVQLAFFGIPSQPSAAWENLGCRNVGFLVDRDVIRVGLGEGTYNAIKLRVRGNRIELFDLAVVYGNGKADKIKVRAIIPDGGETRPLDLAGKARGIDRVEMIYRSQPNFKGQAQVCVDGLQRR